MTIESDLRTYLIADTTVAALVATRMYPQFLPQSVTYPAISYSVVSRVSSRDLSGPSGRVRVRISVNCWAETYAEAKSLSEAVRQRLDGFKGNMGSSEAGSVKLDNSFDDYEDAVKIHRVFQDFIISHTEN